MGEYDAEISVAAWYAAEDLTAKSLHVPIDSFILKKMQEDVDEIRKDGDTYKYKGKSWSQLDDYDVYLDIQAKIGQIAGKTFPIEWEGPAWMDVAKKRSSKWINLQGLLH